MLYHLDKFSIWLEEAKNCKEITEPFAMNLASVSADGQPSSRIVLLKSYNERGFVFYTNLESRKSREIALNPKAALCFYWMPLSKQIRIEGVVEKVSDSEADDYFATRPRESQIGAVVSKQSENLASMAELMRQVKQAEAKFAGGKVPRPKTWSGWRLLPHRIEFWQQGDFRLHERNLYILDKDGEWQHSMLYP